MINTKVKFGICQWCLPIDGPYACKIAADLGLYGIELNFSKDIKNEPLTRKYVQQAYLDAAKEWGITFPSIGINILGKFPMSKIYNMDSVKEILENAIDIAVRMNIRVIQLPSFGEGSITNEEELQQTIEILKYACKISENENIIIGSENALNSEDNLRLISETGYKNLRIYFDTQNPYLFKGYNSAEMVDQLEEFICEVHAKDGSLGKMASSHLGEGESGFYETVKSLKKADYKGWILLENNYGTPPLGIEGHDHIESIKKDVKILQQSFV